VSDPAAAARRQIDQDHLPRLLPVGRDAANRPSGGLAGVETIATLAPTIG